LLIGQKSIDPTIEAAFREVLSQKDAIAALEAQKSNRDDETQKIFDDQQRLRENMKALKGSPEEKALLQRYTQQLNEQENRLAALQNETDQLDKQIDTAKAALDKRIQQLEFDVKL
jgi:septal ring factor EnvC (AmiA/AmiB activator)